MAKQNAALALKESIRLLEIQQAEEGKILKEQFKITYESLKPVNLIKNSIRELTGSAEIKNNLFEAIVSIFTGYLSKKLMVSAKSNIFMKILGSLLQFMVTSAMANNATRIRTFLFDLIDKYFKSAEEKATEPVA